MREILFRGKRLDNGEWVYGDLLQNADCVKIREREADVNRIAKSYVVDENTVGQYTGLTANGKKIFEGDIVKYPIEQGKYSEHNIHEVVFETRGESGYFGIKMDHIETWGFCFEVPSKLMTIIGNIHDNPELLEVERWSGEVE